MKDNLYEIIEHSGEAAKYLIDSEIALSDGDIAKTQNITKLAQQLIRSMKKDSFAETLEAVGESGETLDYDYPNNLELTKCLCTICSSAGSLLSSLENGDDNAVIAVFKKKVASAICTAVEIFDALYEN